MYLSVNGAKQQLPLTDGVFNVQVDLPATSNQLVIAAVGANGGTAQIVRTMPDLRHPGRQHHRPDRRRQRPRQLRLPDRRSVQPGSFDLTNFAVYNDGDNVRMVTRTAGQINNPWGGNGMSTQRLNIYVHDAADTTTTSTPLLPGHQHERRRQPGPRPIVADGRHDTSTYGEGVYGPDTEPRSATPTCRCIPASHQIVVTIPASVFGTTDLATATYQVSMFSDAEDSEGIGNIRPVYSHDCWAGNRLPQLRRPIPIRRRRRQLGLKPAIHGHRHHRSQRHRHHQRQHRPIHRPGLDQDDHPSSCPTWA